MFAVVTARRRGLCWAIFAVLLGATFGNTVSCTDATHSALLTGAHSFASELLNTFFDNLAAQNTFTPVTV